MVILTFLELPLVSQGIGKGSSLDDARRRRDGGGLRVTLTEIHPFLNLC